MKMQRAGFEPAKRCVLGPHPSAFDQAGQPLHVTSRRPPARISTQRNGHLKEKDGTAGQTCISSRNLADIEQCQLKSPDGEF